MITLVFGIVSGKYLLIERIDFMSKVQIGYSMFDSNTGYFTRYRRKTISMNLPTNENGFILFDTLTKQCENVLQEIVIEPTRLLWHQILEG